MGDLYPVSIPFRAEIQDELSYYVENDAEIKDYERAWIEDYIQDEADNSNFLNVEDAPFEFHTVERGWFADTFANGAIAKKKVGPGTVDLWNFNAATELEYLEGNITREEMEYQQFLYSKVVQNYIVRSIKHADGGSSQYDIYSLNEMKPDEVKYDLMTFLEASEEAANMFVELALKVPKNKQAKALSRLPGGGSSASLSKYANELCTVSDDIKGRVSYSKILGKHWDSLAF